MCGVLAVGCYPKFGVGDCGGGEVRSRNSLKIDWRFWGFGSHEGYLVVTMINIYLYRGRDYGIKL